MVKRLPAMWETWVRFLGWEDPLEKGKATHSSMGCSLISLQSGEFHGLYSPWSQRVRLSDFHFHGGKKKTYKKHKHMKAKQHASEQKRGH